MFGVDAPKMHPRGGILTITYVVPILGTKQTQVSCSPENGGSSDGSIPHPAHHLIPSSISSLSSIWLSVGCIATDPCFITASPYLRATIVVAVHLFGSKHPAHLER